MKEQKNIYYKDEINDEFSIPKIEARVIDENYKYSHNILWDFCSCILQNFISMPIKLLYQKIRFRLKYVGKENLKKCKDQGYFIYANHTQPFADTFIPSVADYPKRNFLIVNPVNISLKGTGTLVEMLGAIPIPNNKDGMKNFLDEIKRKIDTRLFGFYENGLYITIKPEQLDNTVISLIRNKCRQHHSNYFVFDIPLPLRETDTVCRFLKELIELKPDHIASDIYYDIVFRYKDMLTDKHYLLYYDELKSLKQEDYFTVKEYIYSHLNLNRTSSNLCIHRNTLNYRLNKIADVLNIDFKDDKQVSNLLLTLKLSDKI